MISSMLAEVFFAVIDVQVLTRAVDHGVESLQAQGARIPTQAKGGLEWATLFHPLLYQPSVPVPFFFWRDDYGGGHAIARLKMQQADALR